MSRRADNGDAGSSLDLLLDTMCNTFGGVIFLAMLLAVCSETLPRAARDRLQRSGASAEARAEFDQRLDLAQLAREKERLETALRGAAAPAAAATSAPPPAGWTDELKALDQREADARRRLEELRRTRADEQADAARLERERARLAAELEQAPPVEPRTLRLPRLHDVTGRIPVFLALRGGRVYAISDLSGTPGFAPRFDEADVSVDRGPSLWIVELKPGAGEPLGDGRAPAGKLADALERTSPDRHFFSIMVYPDAYAQFQTLKRLLLARGYSYIWAPADGAISLVRVSKHDAL